MLLRTINKTVKSIHANRIIIFAVFVSFLVAVPSTLYFVEKQKNERLTADTEQKLESQIENLVPLNDIVSTPSEQTTVTAPAPAQTNALPKQVQSPPKTNNDCDFYDGVARAGRDQSSADSAYNMYINEVQLWNWDSGVYTPDEKTEKNLEAYKEYVDKVSDSYQAYMDAVISKKCPIKMEKPITKSPLAV